MVWCAATMGGCTDRHRDRGAHDPIVHVFRFESPQLPPAHLVGFQRPGARGSQDRRRADMAVGGCTVSIEPWHVYLRDATWIRSASRNRAETLMSRRRASSCTRSARPCSVYVAR